MATDSERKYHGTPSAYVLPNDAIEQQRLDAQAAAITEMVGGFPFVGPRLSIHVVKNAIDVGCGTGVATVQLATLFPYAKVFGMDISEVPEAVQKLAPRNVTWVKANILDVEHGRIGEHLDVMHDSLFNYVFGRMLFLGIDDWPKYFSTVGQTLEKGGMVEHQDLDWKFYRTGTYECVSDGWEWHRAVLKSLEASKLSPSAGSDAARYLSNSGFEIISVQKFEFSFVPSDKAPDSRAMGRYVQAKLLPNYPELLRKVLKPQGLGEEELQRLTAQCLKDLSSEAGLHQKYTVTVARKV